MIDYDAELHRYDEVYRAAWEVRIGDRVLDIGCGTGSTTRHAARLATAGSALGIDVSPAAVDAARRAAEGLTNVAFECADAQTYGFPAGGFDLAISRFGTMFFADPGAAFANVARALRPGGRLVMLVWQARERNEWAAELSGIAAGDTKPDAFSLGDPEHVAAVLAAAGFADTGVAEVRRPVYYGPDVAAAVAWVLHSFPTRRSSDLKSVV